MIKFSAEICHVSGLNSFQLFCISRSRAYFSKYLCVPSKNSQMFFVICSFYQVPARKGKWASIQFGWRVFKQMIFAPL